MFYQKVRGCRSFMSCAPNISLTSNAFTNFFFSLQNSSNENKREDVRNVSGQRKTIES